MAAQGGRPPVVRQRILAVLLAHHRAAGWDKPMPRGELLARLHGWTYGKQATQRVDIWGEPIPLFYTGIDQTEIAPDTYRAAQANLTHALLALFNRGLVKLGSRRRLETAGERIAAIEKDLADPQAAFIRNQKLGPLAPIKVDTLEAYLAERLRVLAIWQAGRGQPSEKVQLVALTAEGRQQAEGFYNSMAAHSQL